MLDTIIIGAGPAGLAAASTLKGDRSVMVIDEYPQAGGRLLGQLYEEGRGKWWNGLEIAEHMYKEISINKFQKPKLNPVYF